MSIFIGVWITWWIGGFLYASWTWRLQFDLTLGPTIFAIILSMILGPLIGVIWHLCWYFENNPVKIPTITVLPKHNFNNSAPPIAGQRGEQS